MFLTALKKTALLSLVLVISGCSIFSRPIPEPEIKIVTKTIERKIVQPTLPREIDLKEPFWYVVSEKNLEEFLERLKNEQGQVVFFAMTPGDYELMAYNLQEIKRYVNEMNQVIIYYKKVTLPKENNDGGEETSGR